MATIQTALSAASTRSAAHVNALSNAWKGLGHPNDNAGRAVLLPGFGPAPVRLSGNERAIAIGPSTLYAVPASRWFVLGVMATTGSAAGTITMEQGVLVTTLMDPLNSTAGMVESFAPLMVFTEGEEINTGASCVVVGTEIDAPATSYAVAFQLVVDSGFYYEVPSGKRALLLAAFAPGTGKEVLTIDGTPAARADSYNAYAANAAASHTDNLLEPSFRTLVLTAGQRVGSLGGTDIVISVIEAVL